MVVGSGSCVRCAMASKNCPSTPKYHWQPLRQPHSASQDGGHCLTIHYSLALSLLFTFLLLPSLSISLLSAHYSYPCSDFSFIPLLSSCYSLSCSHLALALTALFLPLLLAHYSFSFSYLAMKSFALISMLLSLLSTP
jgi:hypothetical protein